MAEAQLQQRMDRMTASAKAPKQRVGKAQMPTLVTATPRLSHSHEEYEAASVLDHIPQNQPNPLDGILNNKLEDLGLSAVVDGSEGLRLSVASSIRHSDVSNLSTSGEGQGGPLGDVRAYVCDPLPKEAIQQCRIMRYQDRYEFVHEDTKQLLLCARKNKKSTLLNYIIALDRGEHLPGDESCLGKVKANFLGTDFVIYDGGIKGTLGPNCRQQLACVSYERHLLGSNGPRKIHVGIPRLNDDGTRVPWEAQSIDDSDSMLMKFKAGDYRHLLHHRTRDAQWSDRARTYVLNFRGRVKQASVKNFQLVDEDQPLTTLMQFGKVDKVCCFNAYGIVCFAMLRSFLVPSCFSCKLFRN